jgi:S-formylglutathione hydrolase FrmB
VVAGAAGTAVFQGWLPGRPWAQAQLGLNGTDGVVPDVEPGPTLSGSFVSEARGGVHTGWAVTRPPGSSGPLPLVVALHGLGADHATLLGPRMGVDRFLAATVAGGTPPYAVAVVDGGRSYWHPRPSGEDASAMVVEELLPLLADHPDVDVDTGRLGLLGWSMGGYGVLRLAGLLGADRVPAVVACSPALWTDAADASPTGFADAEEYDEFSVLGRQDDLAGIAVRVDCGTGDPFYRAAEDYVGGFPDDAQVTSTFEPGGHTTGYWRRMLPAQLDFLGRRLDA